MIYLVFSNTKTQETTRSIQVVRAITIGRSALADIQLPEGEGLSRVHTLIVPRVDGRIDIRDLSSRTGTFLDPPIKDRRRLLPNVTMHGVDRGRAILTAGEKFYIGKYIVEVCYEELLGEPTIHPDLLEEEEEITGITDIEDLEGSD